MPNAISWTLSTSPASFWNPEKIDLTAPGKNKVQKAGVFFEPEKVPAKTPRQPRKSPQLHHDSPSTKHPENTKTPAKNDFPPSRHFFCAKTQNQPSVSSGFLAK
jgi:hypothetical protein